MQAQTPSVTFVVVNWNQRALTLDCLASLREQDYPRFDVVVVDNGSQDRSIEAIGEAHPEVTVYRNADNLGIAAANNVGIRHALEADADYVFLLNNDTVVHPHMLALLVSEAEGGDEIGGAGPTMLYFDEPDVVWCAGNRIDWRTGQTLRLHEGLPLATIEGWTPAPVDFVTSCAVLIKRAAFSGVGLMDERYFIYYDETDWFARARVAGWRFLHVPQAKMWHKVSATMGESSPTTDYYMTRNRFLFLARNSSGWARAAALLRAGWRTSLAVAAYTVKSHGGARLANRNAKWWGLRDAVLGRWGKMAPRVSDAIHRGGR